MDENGTPPPRDVIPLGQEPGGPGPPGGLPPPSRVDLRPANIIDHPGPGAR
ncbi:hypothetical protein LT493_33830 [Streptomyces tricolor]|nr:hypothetical protein [Streptomyces tricolor]